ncbi:hypothetical protein BD779DRAFT_1392904, partial [Infundibulicybe gibba]
MTKIVNNLSAKVEMGSPMVCMYLLGNPDHYKSHDFAVFYWQSYIREARKAWDQKEINKENEVIDELPEKIALIKRHGRVVGLSPVHDYIHRPVEISGLSLYNWVRRCRREKLPKIRTKCAIPSEKGSSSSSNASEADFDEGATASDDGSSTLFEEKQLEGSALHVEEGLFPFLEPHPLVDTHGARCVSEEKGLVPNFVGGMLPCADQGDREYYCSTMLALFKPWRTGADLKEIDETWDAAFLAHKFSEREKELMQNFNLRYECLDARDDFHAQLRAGALNVPAWVDGDNGYVQDEDVGDIGAEDGDGSLPIPEIQINDIWEIGRRQNKRQSDMNTMNSVMVQSGWTEPVLNTVE